MRLSLVDADVAGVDEVDGKLVALARERGARLLTNDTGLGRTAALAGVPVGSVHELALALKPAALPGETLQVQARLIAGFGSASVDFPIGGPPQIPRTGFAHVIGFVHGWRIA